MARNQRRNAAPARMTSLLLLLESRCRASIIHGTLPDDVLQLVNFKMATYTLERAEAARIQETGCVNLRTYR